MEENQLKITNYSAMNQDPEILQKFIDKYVKIQLVKNCVYNGYVQSIDPISYSVILAVPRENVFQTTLIPGFAITDMMEIKSETNIEPPKRKPDSALSLEEIIHKKKKVIAWLKQNLLPVVEAGHNIVVGSVTIIPPYCATDICTDNQVVSLQIKNLLEKMPDNFELK